MAFKYLAHISDNKAVLLHKVTFSSERGLSPGNHTCRVLQLHLLQEMSQLSMIQQKGNAAQSITLQISSCHLLYPHCSTGCMSLSGAQWVNFSICLSLFEIILHWLKNFWSAVVLKFVDNIWGARRHCLWSVIAYFSETNLPRTKKTGKNCSPFSEVTTALLCFICDALGYLLFACNKFCSSQA